MDSTTSILQPSAANTTEKNNPDVENPEGPGDIRYNFRKRKVQQIKVTKKTASDKSQSQKKAILEDNTDKTSEHIMNSGKKVSEASTSGKASPNKSGKTSCDNDGEGKIAQEKLINELSKVEKIEVEESKTAQESNRKSAKANKREQLKRKSPSSMTEPVAAAASTAGHTKKRTKLNSEEAKDPGEKVDIKLNKNKTKKLAKTEVLGPVIMDFELQKEEKTEGQTTKGNVGQSVSTTTENTSEKMNDFETHSNAMEIIINQPAFNFFEHHEKKSNVNPEEEIKENSQQESEGSQHMLTAHDSVIRYKGGEYQAKIPRLRMKSNNKKCKQVWSPEMIKQEEFATYMTKISEIMKTTSDRLNEEKVLKILTQNGQNVDKSLEYIKKNINSVRRDIVLRNRYSIQ